MEDLNFENFGENGKKNFEGMDDLIWLHRDRLADFHPQEHSSVIAKAKAEDYIEIISEMEKTMTVNISHHCDDPNVGMAAYEDLRQYKMFVGDTGLFVTLAFKDKDLYERLFQRRHVEISACLSRLFPVSQPQRLVWLQVEGLFPTQE